MVSVLLCHRALSLPHFFWSLCFVAFRFVACFALFPCFKYFNWCSPFFILKFICCQVAACLFFGISLIKYFLFSPLSPWLLTLLPTLTIVCCGKSLLVEFSFLFFPFLFFPLPPFCFFVLHCGNPNFILPKSYANTRTTPSYHKERSIANYKHWSIPSLAFLRSA